MKRNTIATVFLAILVVGLIPMTAFAADTTTVGIDADTQAQVQAMDSGPGAQVRLLQLERAVTRAKLHGQEVIDALHAQNITNTTDLEAIEAEFSVMITQIQTAEQNANNTDNATQVFVAIKKDATDLVKQFHDTAAPLLKESDKQQLRDNVQKIDQDQLKDITDKIEKTRREANTKRVESTFQNAGFVPSADLLARINDGTATVGDVQKELRDQLKNMTQTQRKEASDKLRDDAAKHRVAELARIDKAEANMGDRESRLQGRIDIAQQQNKTGAVKGLENALNRVTQRGQRVDDREGNIENRLMIGNRSGNGTGRPGMMPGLRVRGEGAGNVNDDNTGANVGANIQTEVTQ